MAFVLADRIKETTIVTGTGTATLLGAGLSFAAFNSVLADTDTTYYTIANSDTSEWEVGLGTYSADTLARTTVLKSSNADALVDFAAGTKDVFITQPADKVAYLDSNGSLIANDGNPALQFSRAANVTGGVQFKLRKARGSTGAESAAVSGDTLFNIGGAGYGATTYPNSMVKIKALTTENWTDAAQGCKLTVDTTPTGTIVPATVLTVEANGDVTLDVGDLVIGVSGKGISFNGGPRWSTGSGTPEGAVTDVVGSLFTRTDGGANTTLYVKESGSGNTGWAAV